MEAFRINHMTSPVQRYVASIQQNDYVTLAIITAVVYDYILTFPKEIEYIWMQSWTRVSTLFILARYFGLCSSISMAIFGSSFFPGPEKVRDAVLSLSMWGFWIFMGAAELVMVLRVWAIYNRSKPVICTLLAIYALEEMSLFATYVLFEIPFGIVTYHVLHFSFCEVLAEPSVPLWPQYPPLGFGLALGVLMCLLTTIQLFKELLQKYKATKRVKLNRYMNCLVKEGIVYFIVLAMLFTVTIIDDTIPYSRGERWLYLLSLTLRAVAPISLVPRFILNLREVYACDVQARRGSNIDTGFGLGSGFEQSAVRSAVAFADLGENESEEWGDEMEMETLRVAHTNGPA